MQTFLSFENFYKSAEVLDNKRLGKQRVECIQLLQALAPGSTSRWQNHPACKMWKGSELYLAEYSLEVCNRWISKGFKDTCKDKTNKLVEENYKMWNSKGYPKWLGNAEFHASHRSNLLRKFPEHYNKFGWTEADNLPYIWPV
jgi:hypothetical protein